MTHFDQHGRAHNAHQPNRRQFAQGVAATLFTLASGMLAGGATAAPSGRMGPARAFSWEWLVGEAQTLSRRPYAASLATQTVPDFDAHVKLSYDHAEALAGTIRLFPARRDVATQRVAMHVVDKGLAREVIDTHGLFGNGGAADAAGFRVLNADGQSDWLAFLGASYFRASGPLGQFGLSARAIAINTALPGPEEFPAFTRFWIETHGPDRLTIYALVDGPSLCGAFALDTARGAREMVQDVTCALFLRRDVDRLGLAPMTSMFDFDEGHQGARGDWRHEVHDSDGLAIHMTNGERIWRPLDNAPHATVHMLRADHVKGFGLIQRDHNHDHYQDNVSWYEKRPSLWVEPKGDWGAGAVMLYEMNAVSETVDNIAAMFVPDGGARAGQRRDLAYRLTWASGEPGADGNARCTDVFVGPGGVPGGNPVAGATRYVFNFAGPALRGAARVEAVTNVAPGALLFTNVERQGDEAWRVTLDIRTDGNAQGDFRLFLRGPAGALSETVIKTIRP